MHPLLAARLACAVASGSAHAITLDGLCFANGAVAAPPPQWLAEHASLHASFLRGGVPCDFLTPDWYVGVLARLHLNVFRVDIPRNDITDVASLARAIAHGSGTAAYLLPSLANHECDPALHAAWAGGDATLTLTARRDIAAGEEVRITYIDSGAGVAERREQLRFAYGFVCGCAACVEEAEGA
jgi:SET and MYND domain-containing protein